MQKILRLERNLAKQTDIYKKASDAQRAIKVIFFFHRSEELSVRTILKRLKMESDKDIVLVDARNDNKQSGSKA